MDGALRRVLPAVRQEGRRRRAARREAAAVRPRPPRRRARGRARPAVRLPRPADALRPLLPAHRRSAHRAAAGVLHARRDGPGAERDRPRGARDRVLRGALDLRLHELDADAVQRRHAPLAAVELLPDDRAPTTSTASTRRSRKTRCCPSSPAASATTGPTCARSARYIKGTNGKSQGVVPFLKVVNDTAVAVNQGGKRKGAVCAYLESWHLDIEEFLELRKNTGDDRRRTHDMNTANWIPDLFMKRVMEGGDWTLFSPSDLPRPARQVRHAPSRTPTPPTRTRRRAARSSCSSSVPGGRPVAQDADDAVRDRPSLDHVQGRLQRALAAAARRRRPLEQPVHRDHAQHRRRPRSRSATSARSTWPQHIAGRQARPGQAQEDGRDARCGCSTTSSTSTTTRSRRRATRTCATVRSASASWASRTRCTSCSVPYASRGGGRVRRPLDGSGLLPRLLGLDRAGRRSAAATRATAARSGTAASCRSTRSTCSPSSAAACGRLTPLVEIDRSATLDWDALRARISEHGMRNSNCVAIAPTATISNIVGVGASIEPSLRQPVGQVEPVGRVHDRQRVPGARPEERSACGTR